MRSKLSALLVAMLMVFVGRGDAAPPASDQYAHLHTKYEKTFLGVDVANVNVTFDDTTRDRFRALAQGQEYSDQVAERIARTALEAGDVNVQVVLLRNASYKDFLDAAHKNLERARDAGYITAANYATAWSNVQKNFAPLANRGFKKGDRLTYHARPGSLHTTVMSANQAVLLDVDTPDDSARLALIASYFAPGSDFRKGLIKDMFN